jgi:hypothetical protein
MDERSTVDVKGAATPSRATDSSPVPSITMHRRLAGLLVVLAAALSPLALGAPATASGANAQLLVKLRADVSATQAQRALATAGARQLRTIPGIGVRVVEVRGAAQHHARAALARDGRVIFAESDASARPMETVPDDPYFPQGDYALGGGAWGWYVTRTTQAWDVTMGDPSVTIAILDTGLKPVGADFAGQLVTGWNVLTGTNDTTSSAGNHGTYVAGVAGLAANNGAGNAGYCPRCRIMPIQVGTDSGASYSDLATGIIWAADHGARVANLSWGGTTASSTLASAVSYARTKGVVVFAAAGNSNCDCPTYPSATPGVLGVAGVSATGAKAGDSNYGSWVRVAAPEGNMTVWPMAAGAGYAQVGGTSLAAPAAAGIAGLLFSARPALTGTQVEQALESTATATPFTVLRGQVDAMAALSSLGIPDPQLPGAPVNTVVPKLLLQINEMANEPLAAAPAVGQVLVRAQGAWTGSAPLALAAIEWQHCQSDGTSCTVVGSSYRYTVQSADSGYALRLRVTFSNPDGATTVSSPLSAPVGGGATPPPSPSPENTASPTIMGTARDRQALTASAGTWSNSPSSYAYAWRRCDAAGASCVAISGAGASSYVLAASDVGSTIRVSVTATNSSGSGTSVSAPTAVVQAAMTQTLTFSGSLSKLSTQSYGVNAGDGASHAALSFNTSKCGQLSLTLKSAAGATLATATGPSVLAVDRTLAAGSFAYTVSGSQPKGCSFSLAVSTTAP